jgi:hypothetical protein
VSHANLLFQHTFDGPGYPSFDTPWPGFEFVAGNPSFPHPVVDGHGHGISNRYQRLLWRGRSTNAASTGSYKADLTASWTNAGGAGRSLGLIVHFVDWDNLVVARLESHPGGSPTLKLWKRVGGVETQLGSSYSGTGISAGTLNTSVTFRVRIEDLTTSSDTSIKVFTDPQGDTGNGDVRITWQGDLSSLRGPYTVGVELGATVGGDDIKVDALSVYDLADEPNPSGAEPSVTSGWVVQLDSTQYEIDGRTGALQALSPPIEFMGCGQAFGFSGGNVAKFRVLGDYRTTILRPGQPVKVWHRGDLRFDGFMVSGDQKADPEETQEWEAKSGIYGALNVSILSDSCEPTIYWNQDPESADTYQRDFADKSIGDIIKYLLTRYRQALQSYGAAPTDGTDCFVEEELQALDGIVPGVTTSGNLLTAVQTLLQFALAYQVFFDPLTRKWHFRDVSDLEQEDFVLTNEHAKFEVQNDSEASYTAVLFLGTRRERDDDIKLTLSDRAWTADQAANHSEDKEHKDLITLKAVLFGNSGPGEPGLVYAQVLASAGLTQDQWRGAIARVDGDAYTRMVVSNTSTKIYMAEPLWGGRTPPPPGNITLDLSHPEAMKELSQNGVGAVYFLPPVEIDGATSCNYSPFGMGLRNQGFCGDATVSAVGPDGARHSQPYYYRVRQPTATAMAAGFCRPLVQLAHPAKKAVGLINFGADKSAVDLGAGGGVSVSSPGEVLGMPSSQCQPSASKFDGFNVSISIPKEKDCAPKLRVPAEGWRGPAYAEDSALWDNGGEPTASDWGVRRELVIQLSEYTSHDMDAGLIKAADAILKLTGQKVRRWHVEYATPWRVYADGGTTYQGSSSATFAGLTKRLTISSGKRSTGFESASSLPVYSVWWDVPGNRTILEAGTAAGWIGGDYGAQVRAITERQAALIAAKKIKDFGDQLNCILTKDPTRVTGQPGGPVDGCTVQVTDSNTRTVKNVTQKTEMEQEAANHGALSALASELIERGTEPTHLGAMPDVPGLSEPESKQVTPRSGPEGESNANHRIPFQGPTGVNGNRSRYGGLIGQDSDEAGRSPEVLFKFGQYAFRKTPNANATSGGGVGLQISPLDASGLPTGWTDFASSMDFPEGKAPLSALNHYSIQHQLKLRDDDLAKNLGVVQDALGAIQSPGDESETFPDGAPPNLASIARTAGLMGPFQMVPSTWNDPAGPVWHGPFEEDGVDPGLYWRIMVPENILCLVTYAGDGSGPNGSNWAWGAFEGENSESSAIPYITTGKIDHKNFSGGDLDWDRRYEPADSFPVSNPFGFDSEENLRLGKVTPGEDCGAGVAFDPPEGTCAWFITYTVSEDPGGTAADEGDTYGFRIDTVSRSSPWGSVSTGSTQTAGLTGDGSNTATGRYKQPGGAVPPGLRKPSDIAVSGIYLPGTGTAPSSASVGVIGVGVDLAIIKGGALIRIRRKVGVQTRFEESPWTSDLVGVQTQFTFEATKNLSHTVGCHTEWALELNPQPVIDEGVGVSTEWTLELNP